MVTTRKVRTFLRRYVERPFNRFTRSGINRPLLRRVVGVLGILLPIVLMVWGFFLKGRFLADSISDYYHLNTQDAFVGILFVIGWVLFAYSGYNKMDGIAGKLACLFAMGVALFNNSSDSWTRFVHFPCAVCLFLLFAFFSLYLFTRTHDSPKGFKDTLTSFRFRPARRDETVKGNKRKRNIVYIICGVLIIVFLILIGLFYAFWQNTAISVIKPVFWLETFMVWAFAFSWFVKGETFWKDKKASAKK